MPGPPLLTGWITSLWSCSASGLPFAQTLGCALQSLSTVPLCGCSASLSLLLTSLLLLCQWILLCNFGRSFSNTIRHPRSTTDHGEQRAFDSQCFGVGISCLCSRRRCEAGSDTSIRGPVRCTLQIAQDLHCLSLWQAVCGLCGSAETSARCRTAFLFSAASHSACGCGLREPSGGH